MPCGIYGLRCPLRVAHSSAAKRGTGAKAALGTRLDMYTCHVVSGELLREMRALWHVVLRRIRVAG